MSSRVSNALDGSLARLRTAIQEGNALNRQALGQARTALDLIRTVQAWEGRWQPRRFPRWRKALRAAERNITVFLRDATRVLVGAGDGGREPKTRQRRTTRGNEARRQGG